MEDAPGRDTRPAYSRRRRTWYGLGHITSAEKDPIGCYLHDVVTVFTDISVLSLPALYVVSRTPEDGYFGVVSSALVVWMTMTVVAAAIRGGWVRPLATDTLGWVSITPSLVGLRIVYYNAVLLGASFGSVAIVGALGVPRASLALAFAIGLGSVLAFPRLGESFVRRRSG